MHRTKPNRPRALRLVASEVREPERNRRTAVCATTPPAPPETPRDWRHVSQDAASARADQTKALLESEAARRLAEILALATETVPTPGELQIVESLLASIDEHWRALAPHDSLIREDRGATLSRLFGRFQRAARRSERIWAR